MIKFLLVLGDIELILSCLSLTRQRVLVKKMPKTRSGKNAAMKDLNVRVDLIGNQLQNQLNELKRSVHDQGNINKEDNECELTSDGGTLAVKLQQFEEFMKMVLNDLRREIAEMERHVSLQCEHLRRRSFRNCILIHGAKETEGEKIYSEVCTLLASKIKADVTIKDISVCYRMGKRGHGNRPDSRAIFVQFVHQWKRDCIFAEKRKLKGSGIIFTEMLTTASYSLLKQVKTKVGKEKCWSWQGNIYASIDNRIRRIKHIKDVSAVV